MAATSKDHLYAVADPGTTPGAIDWSLDDKNPPSKNARYKIRFAKKEAGALITIELVDNTGRGLRYAPIPIDVEVGSNCPPTVSGVHSNEIVGAAVNGNLLTFTDLNDTEVTLTYQLNFVDSGGVSVQSLDPEIINGGKGRSFLAMVICGVGGAIVGALAVNTLVADPSGAYAVGGAIVGAMLGIFVSGLFGKS